jgi:hypothetical protein
MPVDVKPSVSGAAVGIPSCCALWVKGAALAAASPASGFVAQALANRVAPASKVARNCMDMCLSLVGVSRADRRT